jgi:hypothetical protein
MMVLSKLVLDPAARDTLEVKMGDVVTVLIDRIGWARHLSGACKLF